jgi:hypothetical protein
LHHERVAYPENAVFEKVYGVPLTFCCGAMNSPNPSIKKT